MARTRNVPDITATVDHNTEDQYKFDPSTQDHLSSSPMVRDPYERKYLDVERSRIAGAGMGVFARLLAFVQILCSSLTSLQIKVEEETLGVAWVGANLDNRKVSVV